MRTSHSFVSPVSATVPVSRGGLQQRIRRRSAVALLAALSLIVLCGAWDPTGVTAQIGPPGGGGGAGQRHLDLKFVEFFAEEVALNTYFVQGRVTGCAQLGGTVITFGGFAAGQTTTTGSDGTFLLILEVPANTSGYVTAVATCRHGETSNEARYYIEN